MSSNTDPDDDIPLAKVAKNLRREKINLNTGNQSNEPMEIDSVRLPMVFPRHSSSNDKVKIMKIVLQTVADLL